MGLKVEIHNKYKICVVLEEQLRTLTTSSRAYYSPYETGSGTAFGSKSRASKVSN